MRNRLLSAAALVIGTCLTAAGPAATAMAHSCGAGSAQATFGYSMSNGKASVTVTAAGCTPQRVFHVSSYTLDRSAENESTGFNGNPLATPQSLFGHGADIVVPKGYLAAGKVLTSSVALPTCGDYQEDLYDGAVVDKVGPAGHGGAWKAGGIVLQAECAPAPTVAPVTPVPSPTTSAPVTPAPSPTTSAPVTSAPVTPVPSPTTSAPVTSVPAPTTASPTTSAPVTSVPAPTTAPITAPITSASPTTSAPVTSAPAPTAAPSTTTTAAVTPPVTTAPAAAPVRAAMTPLAYTGATGTTVLVVLGAALMIVGAGAVIATRRSRFRSSFYR